MTTQPDIFLSYSRDDQARAKLFAEAFEREGFRVWWDVGLRAGEAYDTVTETALKTAKAVVVLWSKRSVESRWVRAEATLADRNKTLVPAMIEVCERPIMFELTQTAELMHWRGDARDVVFQAFLRDVRRFVGERSVDVASMVPSPPASEPVSVGTPALAVLPFANRSGLEEDEIFAEGMVEDLIAGLSASRRLRVLASGSTVAYRKSAVDIGEVGRLLGVRYLLEGNVRRVGETLRVTAQLVEASNGAILWTQKFDRPLRELAALQEELVAEVAGHLGTQVERIEVERALRKPANLTAWEGLLRFQAALARRNNAEALRIAQETVAIAPDHAPAHAALAVATSVVAMVSGSADLKAMSLRHAERALQIDSEDPGVLAYVGLSLGLSGDPERGYPYSVHARNLAPGFSFVQTSLGWVAMQLCKFDEAHAAYDAFERISPRSPFRSGPLLGRARAYLGEGKPEAALEIAGSILMQAPTDAAATDICVLALMRLGRTAEAEDAMRRYRRNVPDRPLEHALNVIRIQHMRHRLGPAFLADFERVWKAVDPDVAS